MLEPRIENPLNLKLSPEGNEIILENENLPLEKGAVFGGEHYGFNLIVERDGESIATPYATQCSIYGVQIVADTLTILENNKYLPWKFNKDTGELVSEAVFSFLKCTEIDYLRQFGIVSEEDLEKINGNQDKSK